MTAKYPEITVQLSGEDGNIFHILGRIRSAMRQQGVDSDEIDRFSEQIAAAKSYDEALRVCIEWVDCK